MNWSPEEQKAHRVAWVEALRSGKYEQARQHLKTDRGFCCLGVACEISGLGHWDDDIGFYFVGDDSDETFLPVAVRDWLGLDGIRGDYRDTSAEMLTTLAQQNDNGEDFEEIADIIESEPDGLVVKP